MTDLAERMAKLSPEQRALLDRRLRERSRKPARLEEIPRRSRPNRVPLTVDQERIWLIHQFDPNDPVYNVHFAWRLLGELDVPAFEQAVNLLVRRHEALRTTFELEGERPVQVVHEHLPVTVSVQDLTHLPEEEREAAMMRAGQEEVRRPFDITRGPLLRVLLIRLGPQEHVMVGTVDHLVWDRQSLGIFDREVAEFYTALVTGREPQLPELPIHYADYAEWQPRWLRDEVYRRQLPYWRKRLAGASLTLELPSDLVRPPVQTFNGARYEFRLTAELTTALRELARRENVTIYVLLLAAWNLILHRWTGQEDIVVGTTSTTRSRPETERMIGYFLTMLPLRTMVSPRMSFRELLRATRDTVVEAFDHHDIPFGTLLDELDVPRDPSRNPIYQTSFMFVDFHEDPVQMPGLRLEPLVFDNRTAKDDCMLCVFDDEVLADHLFGLFEYNTDLFTEETIARLARHLRLVLTQAVADPSRPVSAFSLLEPDEAERMRVEWNRTAVAREPGLTVDELIRRRAAATPDAIAVTSGDRRLSYAELLDRSGRLANHLRALGAGPETVVGVCLQRSCDLLVGLLGVMLSGAAYLPIDPQYPPRRIELLTADADARLLLTEAALADRTAGCAVERVFLDTDADRIAATSPQVTPPAVAEDRLAYVIYTSGSTGRPKGVEVTQRNLVNLLLALTDEVRLGPDDVLLSVTSVSFDIAGLELYGPLVTGGRVTVATREQAQDPRQLAELIERSGATIMQATPATWHMLVESGWRNPTGIRIVTGGEAVPPSLAAALVEAGETWNVYGPTETTIWSTVAKLTPDSAEVSIGRPIANTELYVLDEDLQPVPVGMPGELYIGGMGVARGYRGRPALTAERFLPDHLGPRAGGRLYRTGDLVRYRADGSLVFLGRGDRQIKLRGYRIELAEIEARVQEYAPGAQVVVLVREDRPGDRRLVAYLATTAEVRTDELREHLRAQLPEYMVPAAFVVLPEFPLTTSGKIDRRALPAPATTSVTEFAAPRDAVELEVAQIWQEVLGTGPIGLHDRFFDLGGHSLLVLRLMAEIERRFGRQLPMAAIFQGATVELFAHLLRDGYQPEQGPHLIELRGGDAGAPVFFAHPAGSEVVCYMPFARLLTPGRPLYAIAPPPLTPQRTLPFATFAERAAAYADLVEQAQPDGPCTVVGWCYGGANAYGIAQELLRRGRDVDLIMIDTHAPVYVPPEEEPGRAPIVEALALNLRWDHTDDQRSIAELEQMTEEEHLDYLLDLARKGDYLPPDAGREQMQEILDLWVANLRLLWRHRPEPLGRRFTMIRAQDGDPDLFAGWQQFADAGVDVHFVEGNHYTMMREPRVTAVAELIDELLRTPETNGRN